MKSLRVSRTSGAGLGYTLQVLILVFAGIVIGAWFADTREPRRSITGVALDAVAHPGEAVRVRWEFEVARDCPGYVARRIIAADGRVFDLPDASVQRIGLSETHLPAFHRLEVSVPIDSDIVPGTATYDSRAFYWCNPLQRVVPLQVHFPPVPIPIVDNRVRS